MVSLLSVCWLNFMKCGDFQSLVPSTVALYTFFLNYDLFKLFLIMSVPLNKGTSYMYLLRNRLDCQSDSNILEQYILNVCY